MGFFLQQGADPVKGCPFAVAFSERIHTSLGVYRQLRSTRPELAANLKEQAERALRFFSDEGDEKWARVMLSLGADPRISGPTLGSGYEDDRECDSTAIEEECSSGKLNVLRRFKLSAETDDLGESLRTAANLARTEVIGYLLDLGAKPNDKANGGSAAIESCVVHLPFEDANHFHYRQPVSRYLVSNALRAIELLVKAGALFRPDDRNGIRMLRRTLLECEPTLVFEVFRIMKDGGAVSSSGIREFLDTPAMQKHMERNSWHLQRLGLSRPPSSLPHYVPYDLLARFNREKLYDEVWAEPMLKVAPRYGVSDVALAKTCRKLKIPLPGRGYWAKLAAGQTGLPRPPLPIFPSPNKTRS